MSLKMDMFINQNQVDINNIEVFANRQLSNYRSSKKGYSVALYALISNSKKDYNVVLRVFALNAIADYSNKSD